MSGRHGMRALRSRILGMILIAFSLYVGIIAYNVDQSPTRNIGFFVSGVCMFLGFCLVVLS